MFASTLDINQLFSVCIASAITGKILSAELDAEY